MTKFARRYASSQTLKTLDYLLPLSFLFALSKHSVPLFGCVQSDDHYYINIFPRERKKERKVPNQNQNKRNDPSKSKAPELLRRRLTTGRKILATHGEGNLARLSNLGLKRSLRVRTLGLWTVSYLGGRNWLTQLVFLNDPLNSTCPGRLYNQRPKTKPKELKTPKP